MIARMGGQAGGRKPVELMSKRLPAGTPIILAESRVEHQENIHKQKSRLNAILSSDEMKQWIRSKMIAPGVLDLSVSAALDISNECLLYRHYPTING